MHSILRCRSRERGGYTCSGVLCVLPGHWGIARKLEKGERAAPDRGSAVCPDCGAKYEIAEKRREAA